MRSPATEPPVLIIGYGNPLRGDDGAGPLAALQLRRRLWEHVHVRVCHQLTPELAEEVGRARLVIFIDASCRNAPGEIECRRLDPRPQPASGLCHEADAEVLLACARRVYGVTPQAYAFAVGGAFWGYSETLSPPVKAVFPELVDCIVEFVTRELATQNRAAARKPVDGQKMKGDGNVQAYSDRS